MVNPYSGRKAFTSEAVRPQEGMLRVWKESFRDDKEMDLRMFLSFEGVDFQSFLSFLPQYWRLRVSILELEQLNVVEVEVSNLHQCKINLLALVLLIMNSNSCFVKSKSTNQTSLITLGITSFISS